MNQHQITHALTGLRGENSKMRTNMTRILVIGLLTGSVLFVGGVLLLVLVMNGSSVAALVVNTSSTAVASINSCATERDNILASNWNVKDMGPSAIEESQINKWLNSCADSTAYLNAGSFMYFVTVQKYGDNVSTSAKAAAEMVNSSLGTGYTGPITAQALTEKETQLFRTGISPQVFASLTLQFQAGPIGYFGALTSQGAFDAQIQAVQAMRTQPAAWLTYMQTIAPMMVQEVQQLNAKGLVLRFDPGAIAENAGILKPSQQ